MPQDFYKRSVDAYQYDGDTYYEDGRGYREAGIDTPEIGGKNKPKQHGAEAARDAAKEFHETEDMTRSSEGTDFYGRILSTHTDSEGVTLAEKMARAGHAQPFMTDDKKIHEAYEDSIADYWQQRENGTYDFSKVNTESHDPYLQRETIIDRRGFGQRALARGIDNLQATGYAFLDATGDLTGFESLEQAGEEGMERNLREAAESPADIATYQEVDGPLDLLKYIAESTIEQAPQVGVDLAVGAVAAATAPFTGGGSVAATSTAMAARQVALSRFKQGVAAAMAPQMVGESHMSMLSNDVDDPATAMFVTGPINTALEYIGFSRLMSAVKFGGDGAVMRVQDVIKEAFKAGGKAAPAEGLTEASQQIVNELATLTNKPSHEIEKEEILESFFRGMAAGGGMATTGRTVTAGIEYLGQPVAETEVGPIDAVEAAANTDFTVSPDGEAVPNANPTEFTQDGEEIVEANIDNLVNPETPSDTAFIHPEEVEYARQYAEQQGVLPQMTFTEQTDGYFQVTTNQEKVTTDGSNERRAQDKDYQQSLDDVSPDATIVVSKDEKGRITEYEATDNPEQVIAKRESEYPESFTHEGMAPDEFQAAKQAGPVDLYSANFESDEDVNYLTESGFTPGKQYQLKNLSERETTKASPEQAAQFIESTIQRFQQQITEVPAAQQPAAIVKTIVDAITVVEKQGIDNVEPIHTFASNLLTAVKSLRKNNPALEKQLGNSVREIEADLKRLKNGESSRIVAAVDAQHSRAARQDRRTADIAGFSGANERTGSAEQQGTQAVLKDDRENDEIPDSLPVENVVEEASFRMGWTAKYDKSKEEYYASFKDAVYEAGNGVEPFFLDLETGELSARSVDGEIKRAPADEVIAALDEHDPTRKHVLSHYFEDDYKEPRAFIYAVEYDYGDESAFDSKRRVEEQVRTQLNQIILDNSRSFKGDPTEDDTQHGRNVEVLIPDPRNPESEPKRRLVNMGAVVDKVAGILAQSNAYSRTGTQRFYDAIIQLRARMISEGYVGPDADIVGPKSYATINGKRRNLRALVRFHAGQTASNTAYKAKLFANLKEAIENGTLTDEHFKLTAFKTPAEHENDPTYIDAFLSALEMEVADTQDNFDIDNKTQRINEVYQAIGMKDFVLEANDAQTVGAKGSDTDETVSVGKRTKDENGNPIEYARPQKKTTGSFVQGGSDKLRTIVTDVLRELGMSSSKNKHSSRIVLTSFADLPQLVKDGILDPTQAGIIEHNKGGFNINKDGVTYIGVNESLSSDRQTYALLHELGHHFYDRLTQQFADRIGAAHAEAVTHENVEEWFADQFASYMLNNKQRATQNKQSSKRLNSLLALFAHRFRKMMRKAIDVFVKRGYQIPDANINGIIRDAVESVVPGTNFTTVKDTQPRHLTLRNAERTRIGVAVKRAIRQTRETSKPFASIVLTADRILRSYAPHIADLFYHQSQSRSTQGTTWFEGVTEFRGRWLNALTKLFDSDIMTSEDAMADIKRLQAGEEPTTQAGRLVHSFLNKFYREIKQNMKGAGFLKNYFPRIYNVTEVRDRPLEFIAVLERFYPEIDGEAVVRSIINEEAGDLREAIGPGSAHAMERLFKEEGFDAALQESGFLYDNPQQILEHYVSAMAKRSEFERVAGEYIPISFESMDEMLQQRGIDRATAINEGLIQSVTINGMRRFRVWNGTARLRSMIQALNLTPEQKRELQATIDAYMGRVGLEMHPTFRKASSWVVVAETYLTLLFSTVASLPDIATTMIRSKDMDGAFRALKTYARAAKNYKEQLERAKTIGYVNRRLSNQAFLEQFGANHLTGKAQKAMDFFFQWNGQEAWTQMTRVMSGAVAEDFMIHHAEQALRGDTNSMRYLQELNVDPDVVTRWRNGGSPTWSPNKPQGLTDEESRAHDELMADTLRIQAAVGRFVDESIVRPNAAMRPRWASDPRFMLLWHLKSFFYAFGKVVIGGMAREMTTRAKQGDYLGATAPLIVAGLFMLPLAALALELREFIQYGGQRDPSESMTMAQYMGELVSRTGAYGPFEMAFGAMNAGEHGSSPFASLAGPAFQHAEVLMFGDLDYKISRSIPVINQVPILRNSVGL